MTYCPKPRTYVCIHVYQFVNIVLFMRFFCQNKVCLTKKEYLPDFCSGKASTGLVRARAQDAPGAVNIHRHVNYETMR